MSLSVLSGAGGPTGGRDNTLVNMPFSSPLGVGGMSTPAPLLSSMPSIGLGNNVNNFSDEGRHFGTGTSVSNWTSTHLSAVMQFSDRFPAKCTQKEMFVFAGQTGLAQYTMTKLNYELPSVNELNRYLVTPQGRATYGRCTNADQILTDFGFAGTFGTHVPEWKVDDMEVMIVAARRARAASINRSFLTKYAKTMDAQFNSMWFVVLRHKLVPKDVRPRSAAEPLGTKLFNTDKNSTNMAALHPNLRSELAKDKTTVDAIRRLEDQYLIEDPYYWQFHCIAMETEGPPPFFVWIDDESVGRCIRIGTIMDYEGMRNSVNRDDVDKARKSMDGVHNLLTTERDYLKLMPLLPVCDVFLEILY